MLGHIAKKDILFVGVTGLPASGKGEFIKFLTGILEKHQVRCRYYSLSDELRAEAKKRGLEVLRPVLRRVANELRQEFGAGILAKFLSNKILKEISEEDYKVVIVIDAIRNPEEVETLRAEMQPKFVLVALEAPIDRLMERLSVRAREDETKDVIEKREVAWEMLVKEAGEGEPGHGHNISKCISLADVRVDNSGRLEALFERTLQFAQEYVLSGFGIVH